LYDHIKINTIKVNVLAVDYPQSVNITGNVDDGYIYPTFLAVVNAWDRVILGDKDNNSLSNVIKNAFI